MKHPPSASAESEPHVGIFWLEGACLYASTVPLERGLAYGECVNGPDDHVDFWPRLQLEHPHLRDLEYFAIPRGRVIYDRTSATFRVFMDRKLHISATKSEVTARFHLPKRQTRFLTDAHYTTDPPNSTGSSKPTDQNETLTPHTQRRHPNKRRCAPTMA